MLDHYSRRLLGFAVFAKQPTSEQIRAFLRRTIPVAGRVPEYLICDQGGPFARSGFQNWCQRMAFLEPTSLQDACWIRYLAC